MNLKGNGIVVLFGFLILLPFLIDLFFILFFGSSTNYFSQSIGDFGMSKFVFAGYMNVLPWFIVYLIIAFPVIRIYNIIKYCCPTK